MLPICALITYSSDRNPIKWVFRNIINGISRVEVWTVTLSIVSVKIGKDATYKMAKSLCKMMDVQTINEFGK